MHPPPHITVKKFCSNVSMGPLLFYIIREEWAPGQLLYPGGLLQEFKESQQGQVVVGLL